MVGPIKNIYFFSLINRRTRRRNYQLLFVEVSISIYGSIYTSSTQYATEKTECMPLSTNKVEKFVVSGKFNCVYLANLADGSIIEYQEKNSFSSKNKKGLSIAIYG